MEQKELDIGSESNKRVKARFKLDSDPRDHFKIGSSGRWKTAIRELDFNTDPLASLAMTKVLVMAVTSKQKVLPEASP